MQIDVESLTSKETFNLIGSDKVEGTKVFDADGEHIGHIERVMLDKISGRVAMAVLAFGGFLGLGQDHYPLPWDKLVYDESLGGYRLSVTRDQLEDAPHYAEEDWVWTPESGERVYDYYGISPYWN